MTVGNEINTPLLVIGCCRCHICRKDRMDCHGQEPHTQEFGLNWDIDFICQQLSLAWLHWRAEGTRVSSCYTTNTSHSPDFKSVWRMLVCCSANPRRSLLSLWAQWRADKRFALFVILLLSLWWFLSCLDLRKHCFSSEEWQSDCDRWNLTLLLKNRNEDVQTHSFLLSECRFPKCRLQQHMAMLHSHFSFTYLDFQPLSPHQSFPIHCLPSSSPISSVCAGNDLCCCKKIYISHFHFHD